MGRTLVYDRRTASYRSASPADKLTIFSFPFAVVALVAADIYAGTAFPFFYGTFYAALAIIVVITPVKKLEAYEAVCIVALSFFSAIFSFLLYFSARITSTSLQQVMWLVLILMLEAIALAVWLVALCRSSYPGASKRLVRGLSGRRANHVVGMVLLGNSLIFCIIVLCTYDLSASLISLVCTIASVMIYHQVWFIRRFEKKLADIRWSLNYKRSRTGV